MADDLLGFEKRKADHILHSTDPQTEATGLSGLDQLSLCHEALPDINFEDITLGCTQLSKHVQTPFLVSSMTAGHKDASTINERLMQASEQQGWAMGVGSQRRELFDKKAHLEWAKRRKKFPKLRIFGNIGIAQCITASIDQIRALVENLDANALQIHLNPLQECIQPEGTPQFKGGLKAIEKISHLLDVPVIIKETGCGISTSTMKRLNDTGIKALDVSGFGGTHWGRIEGLRTNDIKLKSTAITFKNWGISTLNALLSARKIKPNFEIWGSGGVRTGLDAAKLLALGATTIGFARPMLIAALRSQQAVIETMETIEYELKTALFCTGHQTIAELQENQNALL